MVREVLHCYMRGEGAQNTRNYEQSGNNVAIRDQHPEMIRKFCATNCTHDNCFIVAAAAPPPSLPQHDVAHYKGSDSSAIYISHIHQFQRTMQ